jgi:hypothetical protein
VPYALSQFKPPKRQRVEPSQFGDCVENRYRFACSAHLFPLTIANATRAATISAGSGATSTLIG